MSSALILNCCYTSNFGDQAIGITMKKLFEAHGYEVDLYDLVEGDSHFDGTMQYDPAKAKILSLEDSSSPSAVSSKGLKTKLFAAWNLYKWGLKHEQLIASVCQKSYDIAVIGGGELIQSNGIFPFAIELWRKHLKKTARLYFFGIGVTEHYSDTDRKKLQKALDHASGIFVRDSHSLQNVKTVFGHDAVLTSDVVLGAYEPRFEPTTGGALLYGMTSFSRIKRYEYRGLQTRKAYYDDCYHELKARSCFEKPNDVMLLYADIHDFYECHTFSSYLKNEYGISLSVAAIRSFDDFERLIASCKTVISPRMHACIFGMLYGKQTEMLCISDKTKSFHDEYMNASATLASYRETICRIVRNFDQI